MKRKVSFTKSSRRDIKSIVDYIRQDKPIAAEKFKNTLLQKARSLTLFSERGRMLAYGKAKDKAVYRELMIGDYRMIYKIKNETVFIMRVIHGHQSTKYVLN